MKEHCLKQNCKYDRKEKKGSKQLNMTQCMLCQNRYHDDCVNITKSETLTIWLCPDCRTLPTQIQELKQDVTSLLTVVNSLQTQNDDFQRLMEVQKNDFQKLLEVQQNDFQRLLEEQQNTLRKIIPQQHADIQQQGQEQAQALLKDIQKELTYVKRFITDEDMEEGEDSNEEEPEGSLLLADSLGRDIVSTCNELTVHWEEGAIFSTMTKYLRKSRSKYKDLYILCGTNHCNNKKPLSKITDECKSLIEVAKKHATNIHICSIPPRKDMKLSDVPMTNIHQKIDSVNLILANISQENDDCHFVNNDTNFKYRDDTVDETLLGSDGVHLSAMGVQRLIANMNLKDKAKCNFGNGPTNRWSDTLKSSDKMCSSNSNHQRHVQAADLPHHHANHSFSQARQDPIYFRGHMNPLSNFFPCEINVYGENVKSSEHAYQLRKAIVMRDVNAAEEIRQAPTAKHAKDIGDSINEDNTWHNMRRDVMTHILREKLHQCAQYRKALKNSKDRRLIEDTRDSFWARGINDCGLNILGEIHEQLRMELSLTFFHDDVKHVKWNEKDYYGYANNNKQCWNCGESNHIRHNCKFSYPVECYSCKSTGHKMKFCPYYEY